MIEICKKFNVWNSDKVSNHYLRCRECTFHYREEEDSFCIHYKMCFDYELKTPHNCESCPAKFYCWTR